MNSLCVEIITELEPTVSGPYTRFVKDLNHNGDMVLSLKAKALVVPKMMTMTMDLRYCGVAGVMREYLANL